MVSSLNSTAEYGLDKPIMMDAKGICSAGRGAFLFQCSMRFIVDSVILECLETIGIWSCSHPFFTLYISIHAVAHRISPSYVSAHPNKVHIYPVI